MAAGKLLTAIPLPIFSHAPNRQQASSWFKQHKKKAETCSRAMPLLSPLPCPQSIVASLHLPQILPSFPSNSDANDEGEKKKT